LAMGGKKQIKRVRGDLKMFCKRLKPGHKGKAQRRVNPAKGTEEGWGHELMEQCVAWNGGSGGKKKCRRWAGRERGGDSIDSCSERKNCVGMNLKKFF